jgi:SRSO17 transposase
MLRVGLRFARVEPRRRVAAFVAGLLAGLPRVNCWPIAGRAGEGCPRGMRRLLSAIVWDEGGMRDDLRGYVLEHFADPGAVLVVDETGDLKKGTATVGVQRQYTGTAGRTGNAQVAVYLAYAAPAGTAFIDRALYLPRSWAGDLGRCAATRSAGSSPDCASSRLHPGPSCAGPDGDAGTKPPFESATTGDEPSHPHDHGVLLGC